jgi:hypothetical protein
MKLRVDLGHSTRRRWGSLGVVLAGASLLLARTASAERCAIWPAVFPADGEAVSPNTHLWVVCAAYENACEPLTLRDASGTLIPLVEVEQRRILDGPPRRLIRYAPRAELAPGSYELTDRSRSSLTFRVVSGRAMPPRVPTVLEYQFTLRGAKEGRQDGAEEPSSRPARFAQFTLAADDGLLVADVGEANDDPLDVVSDGFARRGAGQYTFLLGWGACRSTLPEADYCTRTRARFGTLSGEGTFSGWTPWQAVDFPGPDCVARAARERRERLGRWGVGALGVAAAFGGAIWLLRRRRSRA